MKILFVTERYYPENDATALVVQLLCEELQNRKQEVHILSVTGSKKVEDCVVNNIPAFHVFSPTFASARAYVNECDGVVSRASAMIDVAVNRISKKLAYDVSSTGVINRDVTKIERKIRELINEHGYDVVITATAAFSKAVALESLARSKEFRGKVKFGLIETDPYVENIASGMKGQRRRARIKRGVYEALDFCYITPQMERGLDGAVTEKYKDRIQTYEFPKLSPPVISSPSGIEFDREYINCVYLGMLDASYRNPTEILERFKNVDKKIRLYIFGYGCEQIVSEYACERIIMGGSVSHDRASAICAEADILLNLNSTMHNMLPSKLLEYFSYGKPVINFSYINDCPSLKYTQKYPLCLNISMGDRADDSRKIEEFAISKSKASIPISEVEKLFSDCTPGCLAKSILSWIQ